MSGGTGKAKEDQDRLIQSHNVFVLKAADLRTEL
jgi:hypothetical protein